MLIGITGTDGSGKGTVVDYLVKEKGFTHYSARAIWLEIFKERNIEPSRANMRLVANEMREKHGNDFVVSHYLRLLKEDGAQNAIIESIRATAEAETLKSNGGILVAVDAGQEIRYARVQRRRSESDKVTLEQFIAHEDLETNDPNPHGMQKQKVIAMADFIIMNNGTLEELHAQIEEVFNTIERV